MAIDERINRLKQLKNQLNRHEQTLRTLANVDLKQIKCVEKAATTILLNRTDKPVSFENAARQLYQLAERFHVLATRNRTYGSIITVKSLQEQKWGNYTGMFLEVEHDLTAPVFTTQPAGKYLQAFCVGWHQFPTRYTEILTYAKKHHIQLSGLSYERGINQYMLNDLDDYVTQIEIQIAKH